MERIGISLFLMNSRLFIDFPTFASTSIRRYKLVFSSDQKKYDSRFIEISRDALMRDCPPIRSFKYVFFLCPIPQLYSLWKYPNCSNDCTHVSAGLFHLISIESHFCPLQFSVCLAVCLSFVFKSHVFYCQILLLFIAAVCLIYR